MNNLKIDRWIHSAKKKIENGDSLHLFHFVWLFWHNRYRGTMQRRSVHEEMKKTETNIRKYIIMISFSTI